MYLAPYIACVGVFAVSLVFAIRSKSASNPRSKGGIVTRAVLTFLAFAFVAVLWHYTGEHYLDNKTVELWVRVISTLAFLCSLPEIWLDTVKGE